MMTHVVSPTAARSWARSLDRDETVGPREAIVRLVDGSDLEGPLGRRADASPGDAGAPALPGARRGDRGPSLRRGAVGVNAWGNLTMPLWPRGRTLAGTANVYPCDVSRADALEKSSPAGVVLLARRNRW